MDTNKPVGLEKDILTQPKIRLESENFFCYLNEVVLYDEYLNPEGIQNMVNDLNRIFFMDVADVYQIWNPSGRRKTLYRLPPRANLPGDQNHMDRFRVKWEVTFENILNKPKSMLSYRQNRHDSIIGPIQVDQDEFELIIKKYFHFFGFPLRKAHIQWIEGGPLYKWRKNNQRSQWSLVHSDAYGSPIEEELGEALKKLLENHPVSLLLQEEIYWQDTLLTRPDFLIPEVKLAIYCDGFQYHYNKESVIKDRTQDRKLQMLGYHVFRYTGSEIKGGVMSCAAEVKNFVQQLLKGAR